MTRRTASALAGALAAGLVGACATVPFATPASAASTVAVEAPSVTGRTLSLIASVFDPQAPIDAAKFTVRVQDTELTPRVQPVDQVPARRVLPRVAVLVLDLDAPNVDTERLAARAYLAALPSDVRVALVAAARPARVVLPPTADRDRVGAMLAALAPGSRGSLVEAVDTARTVLIDRADQVTQPRIVVFTAGPAVVTGDVRTLDAGLQNDGTAVDVLAYRVPGRPASALRSLTGDVGGRFSSAPNEATVTAAARLTAAVYPTRVLLTVDVPADFAGVSAMVEVDVAMGDATATGSLPVTFPPDPGTVRAARLPRQVPLPYPVLAALVFGTLLAVALLLVTPAFGRVERRRRLAEVERYAATSPVPVAEPTAEPESVLARFLQARGWEQRIADRLDRAGMRLRPHEWVLLRAGATLGAAVLFAVLFGLLGLVVGAVLGWLATELYRQRRASRRTAAFRAQLPDALRLVIGSVRSGFSLAQAIDAMCREVGDPIGTEFGRALAEARLGMDLEEALDRLARRIGNHDLSWAVMAIRVQRDVGGNLAEVLTTSVDTLRERETLRGHVRALSAEGRISAYILLALPVAVGAAMAVLRREYIAVLFTDPRGILMLLVGVLLVLIGGVWLNRVTRVEL
ncbi:MAG TPA: type II secretion system F family protein [Micromonosporaceae bacterium]